MLTTNGASPLVASYHVNGLRWRFTKSTRYPRWHSQLPKVRLASRKASKLSPQGKPWYFLRCVLGRPRRAARPSHAGQCRPFSAFLENLENLRSAGEMARRKTREKPLREEAVVGLLASMCEEFPSSVSETSACTIEYLFKVATTDSRRNSETVTDRRSSTAGNRSFRKWRRVESDVRGLLPLADPNYRSVVLAVSIARLCIDRRITLRILLHFDLDSERFRVLCCPPVYGVDVYVIVIPMELFHSFNEESDSPCLVFRRNRARMFLPRYFK